jgi:hypothetical protein
LFGDLVLGDSLSLTLFAHLVFQALFDLALLYEMHVIEDPGGKHLWVPVDMNLVEVGTSAAVVGLP